MQRTKISNRVSRGLKLALATAVAVVITACSSSDGGGGNTPPTAGTGPLAGTWDQCTGTGFKLTLTFTDSRWVDSKTLHNTEDCSDAPAADNPFANFIFEGTYELVGTSTSEDGLEVQQINLVSDKFDGSALVPSAVVRQFNIVYTGMAGQLIFGDEGFSEANRPTALDFDAPYIRR